MSAYRPIITPPKRKPPNLTEKLAAAILAYEKASGQHYGYAVDAVPLMKAKDYVAMFDFDHEIERALTGSDHWSELVPMYRPSHKEKTRKRAPVLAKVKRQMKAEVAHRARVETPAGVFDMTVKEVRRPVPVRTIRSRGFPKVSRPMRKR